MDIWKVISFIHCLVLQRKAAWIWTENGFCNSPCHSSHLSFSFAPGWHHWSHNMCKEGREWFRRHQSVVCWNLERGQLLVLLIYAMSLSKAQVSLWALQIQLVLLSTALLEVISPDCENAHIWLLSCQASTLFVDQLTVPCMCCSIDIKHPVLRSGFWGIHTAM